MAAPIAFESSWVKKEEKQKLQEARQEYLEKAKKKYEKEEKKLARAKERGEDSWMLPSVSDRLDNEQKELERSKAKKHKKEKKRKKMKKEKKKREDSSDTSEDEAGEGLWVEKSDSGQAETKGDNQSSVKGPRLQRDSWMSSPLDLIPTISRDEIRKQKLDEEKNDNQEVNLLDQPGQDVKELNPYWKDGGTGMPEGDDKEKRSVTPVNKSLAGLNIGDSGISWLRKAYSRCQQQAQDEGRSLDEIASERYGSLEKLEKMLAEAESKEKEKRFGHKPGYGDRNKDKSTSKFIRPRSRSSSRDRGRPRSRSRERRKRSRSRDRNRSRSHERASKSRRSRSNSTERGRPRSRSKERRKRSRSRSRERKRSRSSERMSKTTRSRERIGESPYSGDGSSLGGKFMKPGDSSMVSGSARREQDRNFSSQPAWKKKTFQKCVEAGDGVKSYSSDGRDDPMEGKSSGRSEKNRSEKSPPRWRKPQVKEQKEKDESSSSDGSDSSEYSSSGEDSRLEKADKPSTVTTVTEAPLLSDLEMNELGAKILRAEIMGNEELAQQLKSRLEAAQAAKEQRKSTASRSQSGEQKVNQEGDQVAVLTRTDKRGMVRPLPDRQHPIEPKGGRRKQGKVSTHATGGARERYFDDDDKFDLKTLVEREKMGTAEDQNSMFARLAGRAAEKTDDDFQVDDLFIKNASKKQNDSKMEERDRNMAVFEHKKMTAALDKCQFCFDNVAKHLIIAIGSKVYLCLPNCRSLTEGHCLIVPMQHVSSGTALDEDVWNEMQVFRKALTRMFEVQDQDCVFMETAMYLKKFPHMSMECVPLPRELGDMAPIYFKKAILDSESEWAQNKKVVDISQKDIRHAVPKGFPYFSVDFGTQGGFAHVIEDEQTFTSYFGKEILGGMIDAEPRLWRKPWKENFEEQRKKVLQFADWWKPHDWTQNIGKMDENG